MGDAFPVAPAAACDGRMTAGTSSLAADTGKGEMGSLDMSGPSAGLILHTHSTQSPKEMEDNQGRDRGRQALSGVHL